MNEQLAQLVAAQLGNGSGVDPTLWANALTQNGSDPLTVMLMSQMLAARQQKSPEVESDDDDGKHDLELERLRRSLARARQELASANVMARYIASTFGACPSCWGLNQLCAHCGGKGGPGYADLDVEAMRNWVEPALGRAGLAIVTTS